MMFSNRVATSRRPIIWGLTAAIFSLLLTTGCSEVVVDSPKPSSTATPALTTSKQPSSSGAVNQCPPFNPVNTICNAQYDPVCVKTQVGAVISYRTAGNACSACSTPEAIAYVQGECI